MDKEKDETQAPEVEANGTSGPEKSGEVLTGKKVEENDEVKSNDEDKKDKEEAETEKMDEDPKVNEKKESREEKEKVDQEEKEELRTEELQEKSVGEGDAEVEEKEDSKEEVEEKTDESEECEEKEEKIEEKGLKKHGKGKDGGVEKNNGEKIEKKKRSVEHKKNPEPRTPASDRPQRERKSVERLVTSIEKDAVKEFHIEKGRGTPLKDIPNVAFKLSRRKTDDTFKLLHTILFGRRGKAIQIKSNISRFSGFVWRENEEKQKIKVKDKFDKCNKEKLLEFCDMLDLPVSRATTKKEDIVSKLIDFLVAPHATTTVLLAEKEASKSKKRKRVTKSSSGSASSVRSAKSQKKAEDASKTDKRDEPDTEDESEEEKEEEEDDQEENENGVPEKSDSEMPDHSESEENASEEESEDDAGKHRRSSKTSSGKKQSAGRAKTKKIPISSKSSTSPKAVQKKASSKRSEVGDDSDASQKVSSRKKKTEKVVKEKSSTPAKSPSKVKKGKRAARGKEKLKVKEELKPTDDELRDAICEILKEVDFNTATFTDILKQLARQFDTDLTPRKASIKLMIQEELTKLADEADDEDREGGAEKDENQSAGQEVEA